MGLAYFDAHSIWQYGEKPLFPPLTQDQSVDTCVIGAGLAGLSVAYNLVKAGQSVIVLERERIGLGETGLTAAHLSNALDEGYVKLLRVHGLEGARMAAESHTAAIEWIEQVQMVESIECGFRRLDGYLFLGEGDSLTSLTEEREAAQQAGLTEVQLLPDAVSGLRTGPCLHFPQQAQFHPLQYLSGLARAVERLGGRIYTHTEVTHVNGGSRARVSVHAGPTVDANNVVVATNVPFNNRLTTHVKNAAHRTYVLAVPVPPSLVSSALFWDTAEPYHYLSFIQDPGNGLDLLLVGGEDHRTGQDRKPEDHFAHLEEWLERRFGLDQRPVMRWSGQVMEPLDGLAYIGRNPRDQHNVFIVTGDSGHGLTHGTIAGLLISDLILGRSNPWSRLYEPSRLYLNSLPNYVKDLAQSTTPYSDWLRQGDVTSSQEITPGEGAVMRDGLRKVAVYKDNHHRLHCCSAICPHLGGIVRWNSAEKTWDCPCHGSRFDRFGQVLNGPAATPLPTLHDPLAGNLEELTE